MKFFKKGSVILIAGIVLPSCTACSGLDKLADGLKSGVEQVGSNVAIGKSNALITPYQSFDTISGVCRLVYIDPELEENVLAENGDGSITIQLKSGANYIGLYGADYDGIIQITVE